MALFFSLDDNSLFVAVPLVVEDTSLAIIVLTMKSYSTVMRRNDLFCPWHIFDLRKRAFA